MNVFAEFDRRMVAEWEARLKAASEAGDITAFEHAEKELANYRAMLAQSCPALSDGHSPDAPCR